MEFWINLKLSWVVNWMEMRNWRTNWIANWVSMQWVFWRIEFELNPNTLSESELGLNWVVNPKRLNRYISAAQAEHGMTLSPSSGYTGWNFFSWIVHFHTWNTCICDWKIPQICMSWYLWQICQWKNDVDKFPYFNYSNYWNSFSFIVVVAQPQKF